MNRFKHFSLALALIGFTAAVPAQLVINEVSTVVISTDDIEYVELYDGGAMTSLTGIELRAINGANGNAYNTIDIGAVVSTMPADGYLVIGSNLVPNVDVDLGAATNIFQNGDPDALQIVDTAGPTVLDAVAYFTQYDSTPGTPENASLGADAYEGTGGTGAGGDDDNTFIQTGTAASAQVTDFTFGRFPDGADTDNNQVDFNNLFVGRTPGTSNAAGYAATASEDFSQATGLNQNWAGSFTDVVLEVPGTASPAGIPNSPDGTTPGEWASIKDGSGGGDQAMIMDVLAQDYTLSAYVYSGDISTLTLPDTEVGGIFARANGQSHKNNFSGSWDVTNPIGRYGNSLYGIEVDYNNGTATAFTVEDCVRTDLNSIAVPVGWNLLQITCNGGDIQFGVNGSELDSLSGETPRAGYVGVGYRELDSVGAGTGPYELRRTYRYGSCSSSCRAFRIRC
jgi:hypothetical protein